MSDAAPPLPRAAVLALAVVTVVAVGALSLALFWGDIVEDGDQEPAAAAPVVGDDFERPDATGLADDEHRWEEVGGTWVVQDGHAAITDLDDMIGLAILPTDGASAVEVTATAVEPGWGFAFRMRDLGNYWVLVAHPDRGSWSLAHLEDGVVVDARQDFLAVEPTDGSVVQVVLAGDRIRVTVGDQTEEVVDPAPEGATDVGLYAAVGGSLASMAWDDLRVTG